MTEATATTYPAERDPLPHVDANTPEDGQGVEHDVMHARAHALLNRLQDLVGLATGMPATSILDRLGQLESELAGKLAAQDAPELVRDTIGTTLVAGANVSITPDDVANTVTIAATGGGTGSSGGGSSVPSAVTARVYRSSGPYAGNGYGAWLRLDFDAVGFDPSGIWNSTSRRFEPPAAGFYLVTMRARTDSTGQIGGCAVARRGTLYCGLGGDVAPSYAYAQGGSALIYCDGPADYLEGYVWKAGMGNFTLGDFDTFMEVVGPLAVRPAETAKLLDGLSAAAAMAYSVRKLRSGYIGPAMRVRRSVDNAEQDVGFTSTGMLDTAALLTFAGAGSAYVVKLYDQSGNGRHAVQGDVYLQPRIVNAGTLHTLNTRPAFDHATQYWTIDNAVACRNDWTVSMPYFTAQSNAGGPGGNWWQMNGWLFAEQPGVVNDFAMGNFGNRLTVGTGNSFGSDVSYSAATPADLRNAPGLFTATRVSSTGAVRIYHNGQDAGGATLATGDRSASTTFNFGNGNNTVMQTGELVVFASAISADDLAALMADQRTFWGLT